MPRETESEGADRARDCACEEHGIWEASRQGFDVFNNGDFIREEMRALRYLSIRPLLRAHQKRSLIKPNNIRHIARRNAVLMRKAGGKKKMLEEISKRVSNVRAQKIVLRNRECRKLFCLATEWSILQVRIYRRSFALSVILLRKTKAVLSNGLKFGWNLAIRISYECLKKTRVLFPSGN